MDLVDRGAELSIMENMLGSCVAGHGGVLLVSGAVVTGKTALLRAFGERATAAGALFLQATASEVERDLPLGVMGQLLLGADLPAPGAQRAARLLDLVTVTAPARPAGGGLPAVVRNAIPQLCGILLEKSRERPVVIGIDDVHHADTYSLECVQYLARRLDAARILVLLGENSGYPTGNRRLHVELLRLPGCRNIRLGPLRRRGVAEMVSAYGRSGWRSCPPVPDLHRLGGGNPLLTRALLEDHRASAAGTAGRSVPPVPGDSFEQAVTTCLYRSDVSARRTAWALAVLGPQASRTELVAEVLGVSREAARRGLSALTETGLLSTGWFRHEAGRAATLKSMEPAHRARLEARAAQVLHEHGEAATAVVRHLILAEPVDAPWALPTLLEAAERALDGDEVDLALACLRVARDTCADGQRSPAIRAAMTRAGWRVNPATAAQHLPELTTAALEGRLGPRHTEELVGHLLWFGHVDRALEVLGAVERSRAPGRTEGGGRYGPDDIRRWMVHGFPGFTAPVRVRPGRAGPRDPVPARTTRQRAANLMRAVLDGAGEDAVAGAEQILQGTRLDDHTVTALVVALNALVLTDRLDRASFWCEALAREAAARRAPMWQALLASVRARIDLRLGRLAAAAESARSALALVPPEGWGVAVAGPVATVVHAETAMGRLDEAAGPLGVPVPDPAFHTPDGLLHLRARGFHHLAAGRPYAALDDFVRCGYLMARWGFDLPALVPWRTDAAQGHLALGDAATARALAEEQLAMVGPGRAWTRGVSLRVLAGTLDPLHRMPLLEEAAEILRERGHRLELARVKDDLARAHRELGERGRARSLARRAQQLARECGVPAPRVAAAAGALPAGRPEPSGAPRRGHVELSDAELRVATLAARGHTNRQIADKLFITVSTVEQHLTRAYRKLAVQRRADLAGKLTPGGAPDGAGGPCGGSTCDQLNAV
ncbi:AAA family ATPase [Streptomyces sp. WAC 00631]|uniref:AAA family ATPase n=1 Tax=Streptomyces sp. WAC 00631 TaxID=2203201 RepID=UPI000F7A0132|nr:LuxR family transcriptional regulator [Streptomyces sp. WAC 00631]MCC5036780.1 AAA family ATPase [Streptomyces sp. WAC 00631]